MAREKHKKPKENIKIVIVSEKELNFGNTHDIIKQIPIWKRCDFTLNVKATEIQNPKLLSPLTLAFLGDAVFELLVREELVLEANMPVARLHHRAVSVVCAGAQSDAVAILEPILTEEELEIYKRGRNANGHHVPKNADPAEYRRATGLEAVFGYLYLKGQEERIRLLYQTIRSHTNKAV